MAKKKRGLLQAFNRYILVPAGIMAIVLAVSITMAVLYSQTERLVYIIILSITALLTLASYVIFYLRLSKKLKVTYFEQLYETTYKNINKIKNNDMNLLSYGDSDIREIQMLDKATDEIRAKLESSYLVLRSPEYDNIKLKYVNKDLSLITYQSFKENISSILFVSQSYRNLIIEVYFDLPKDMRIKELDKGRLLDLYRATFKEHPNTLYMFGEDERSLIIYLPVIDSFNEIKEKLNLAVTESSLMVRDEKGIQNRLAKYALVAYPYSNEEMILGDLKYAVSQNKPFNLYLPTRFKTNIDAKLLMNTSMNLNYSSKIIGALSNLDYSAINNEKNHILLNEVFDSITGFLDIDDGGIIVYNSLADQYQTYSTNSKGTMFNGAIDKSFVEKLGKAVDDDDVYYFSTVRHAGISLQQPLSMYGIQSGIYYVIRELETDKIFAIVYLFNKNKDMLLNTYLRETFLIISLRIENYFEKREIADYADMKTTENENILALANMFVYHIDDEHNITYLSKNVKKIFPKIKVGEKCYKQMFGYEKACKDCPLATRKKKYFESNNNGFEASMTLSDRKDDNHVMLIKSVKQDEVLGDLYQEDFLTYSYKSFFNALKNEYVSSGRGYVLLLCIDNYLEIIHKLGAEGYNYLIRDYVRSVKNKLNIDDIYYYNPSTLIMHFPTIGHKDIITKIENIYPLSKQVYYDSKDLCKINITYLPLGYPRVYANAEDYMRHIAEFYREKHDRNKDYIYFADYPIQRSASKREFMLSTLESEFSGHNSTSMNLQPMVRVKDRHIVGAEILLRIADAHRNVFFNAQEISQLAEQEKKTGLITESIINFIGHIYKEYGNNIFRINKFNRIAINIDKTYLDDKELLTKLVSLSEENNLPAGFVSLEIPEDMIPENKDKIKALADQLEKYKILFSCDRYIGQYTNIDELSYLGFKEIKIARDIILKIDSDQVKYESLKKMVADCKANNIGVSAVGVENETQFKLLKELDEDMFVQGYYLYKPLTRADLITALVSYEQ